LHPKDLFEEKMIAKNKTVKFYFDKKREEI